ncbi:hypothetical protein [Thiothrix subterranea]|uniref:hypothetical protein n=1 Tax=Thiothrix subterranea TaxID=2735563 RepID=UPI00280B5B8D|nr:hypothetical protein [Thiothrix subterranea]
MFKNSPVVTPVITYTSLAACTLETLSANAKASAEKNEAVFMVYSYDFYSLKRPSWALHPQF